MRGGKRRYGGKAAQAVREKRRLGKGTLGQKGKKGRLQSKGLKCRGNRPWRGAQRKRERTDVHSRSCKVLYENFPQTSAGSDVPTWGIIESTHRATHAGKKIIKVSACAQSA